MVFELIDNIDKVAPLFAGWEETLIYSCIQQIMGKLFVTDINHPKAACASVGCFSFYAGEPDRELVRNKPEGFTIMVPQNAAWSKVIESCFPDAKKVTRYAIRKDTQFDEEKLRRFASGLPDGYRVCKIDGAVYDKCLLNPVTADFVSVFNDKEMYLKYGLGMVIFKGDEIVSGASSYTRYLQGIEIEVDTIPSQRRKNLATAACASLILECLKEGLYPSWDAQNINSVHLAEKLGYEFSHEYTAYEIWDNAEISAGKEAGDENGL